MINEVVLVGRITKDIELKKTQTGKSVVSFTVAVDNPTKEKSTSFIPCEAWENLADTLYKFTHKGSLIGVEGRLYQRSYDSKDGKKVSILEVIVNNLQLLDPKPTTEQKPVEEVVEERKPEQSIDDEFLPF